MALPGRNRPPFLLEGVYAPSIIKIGKRYQMWFTDVSGTPWEIRQADSLDGIRWRVFPDPVIKLDQAWEKENLFYPTVHQNRRRLPDVVWQLLDRAP